MSLVKRFIHCFFIVLSLETCFSTSLLRAASSRDELLRLVPADVGFCLVLENLREHGQALTASPFWHFFKATPFGMQLLAGPEIEKLKLVEQFLQEHFQLSAVQLRDDILGDALVLCYRPGPPGKPDQEQGLLLLRARDEKLLARLVERVNAKQKESGELQSLEELSCQGRKYFRRIENSKPASYFFVHGPVLGLSTQESILQQVLGQQAASTERESALAQAFRSLGVDKPLATLWINPRAFDAGLSQKLAEAKPPQAAALRTVQRYWQALEGIAVCLVLGKDIELSFAARVRPELLSPTARQLAHKANQSSVLWTCFPENAFMAAVVRIDVAAALDFVKEFLDKDAQASASADVEKSLGAVIGKEAVRQLLAHLGPDLGFVVFPPPPGDPAWVPRGLVALRIQGGPQTDRADLTVHNLLNTLSILAVYSLNGGRPGAFKLKSTVAQEVDIKYLVNDRIFPNGFRPAFALKKGFLVLATAPEVIERFEPKSDIEAPGPALKQVLNLRISFKSLQDYLSKRKSEVAQYLADKNHVPIVEATQGLTKLQTGLQFLSTLEAFSLSEPNRATLTFRLRLVRSLE